MSAGYVRETQHYDGPVSPLFSTLILPLVERGFRRAQLGGGAIAIRCFDHHVYTRWIADARPPPERPTPDLGDIVRLWRQQRVPEIEARLEALRNLVRPGVSPRRAWADIERLEEGLEALYALHYDTSHVAQAGVRMMESFLAGAGDSSPGMTVAVLLAPTESALREIDAELAHIAALVHDEPLLISQILHAEPPAVVAMLLASASPAGEAFRPLWRRIAPRPTRVDIASPTWAEHPAALVSAIRGGREAATSFEAGTGRAMERRQEAEARTAVALGPVADMLPLVLTMLRDATGVAQTINHLVGEIALGLARGVLLRVGGILAADRYLDAVEDVFLLERKELMAALAGVPVARGTIEARRASLASAARATPPDVVGDVDAATLNDPRLMALLGASPPPAAEGVAGIAASPGRLRARALVARHETDLTDLRVGDVLVVDRLSPEWTSVMLRAGAIVAATGGMLSHAAIVAREMGKPAVVGAAGAVAVISTGDEVEVDGATGHVLVVKPHKENVHGGRPSKSVE